MFSKSANEKFTDELIEKIEKYYKQKINECKLAYLPDTREILAWQITHGEDSIRYHKDGNITFISKSEHTRLILINKQKRKVSELFHATLLEKSHRILDSKELEDG